MVCNNIIAGVFSADLLKVFSALGRLEFGRNLPIMKKIIAMLLLSAMLVTLLAGCSTLKDGEKGAVIHMYTGNEITDFDPAIAYTDDTAAKMIGLLFEGLTRIGKNGKVENALMKSYKIIEDEAAGNYAMEITIKETKWSDGRALSADDIVYAWKRILDPEFSCAAASLLFDIKNARDVKMGDNSIDDLGIAAVDTDVIEVQFEGKIDYKQFLENLACLALVPLREDVVSRYERFGTSIISMCSNGPFAIKGMTVGEELVLGRNEYYYRDSEGDDEDALDKYVLPYRLVIDYTRSDDVTLEEKNLAAYENGEIFYLGDIALDGRDDYKKKAKTEELMSTHSYMFNIDNDIFANADVRRGLSLALDREAIADLVVFAEPATGLVPSKVYDKKVGDDFRKNGGKLIASTADATAAAELIGGKTGKFEITCHDSEVDIAIAEYAESIWEELGFKVDVKALDAEAFKAAYETGDYDVIAVDYQSPSTDAFGVLSVFAPLFSGMGIDIQNDNYDPVPYIIGYDNEEYNALIESAFAEKKRSARSEYLHDAEELLLNDMAIMPIIFNEDAYLVNSKKLSGIDVHYYGYKDFNDLELKNWRDYVTE